MNHLKQITLSFMFLIPFSALAEEAATPTFRAGPNLAVQEADLKKGFRLSPKAQEFIRVKVKPVGPQPYSIPTSSLVYYGDKVGVYRLREGWFKLIEVKHSDNGNTTTISSSDLEDKDQVAIEGVALLRVSEMDAFGGEQ